MSGTIRPWSVVKLDFLAKYLWAYTTALKKQRFTTCYVDAFAGSGQYEDDSPPDPELVAFVDGSPLVALKTDPPFSRYVFVELSKSRADALLERVSHLPEARDAEVIHGEANEALQRRLIPLLEQQPKARALCFLDPYGIQLEWDTVVGLARTGRAEVIINFCLQAVHRYGAPQRYEDLTEERRERLARVFGTLDWPSAVYQEQATLFGPEMAKRPDASRAAAAFYLERLATQFRCTAGPLVMVNSRNSPLYAIVWAGPHPLGQKIVQKILSKYEE